MKIRFLVVSPLGEAVIIKVQSEVKNYRPTHGDLYFRALYNEVGLEEFFNIPCEYLHFHWINSEEDIIEYDLT